MIAYIKGQVLQLGGRSAIIMSGDLGYEIFLPPKSLSGLRSGQPVEFFVYSHVKDDAIDFYGFNSSVELDFFKKLISVAGVGPKSALNVLGLADVMELKRAIGQGDALFLQKVSGIGKKTAERLVVELKEKFINELSGQMAVGVADEQVRAALITLGYKEKEVAAALQNLNQGEGDLASRLKAALRAVSK